MAEKLNIKELTPESYGQFLIYTLKTTRSYGGRKVEKYRVAILDANTKTKLIDFVPGGNEGVSEYDGTMTKEKVIVAMKKYIDHYFKNYSSDSFAIKVGDIFEASWGYDQTQYEFVKVLAVGSSGTTVKVADVKQKTVEREISFMTDMVAPTHEVKPGTERIFKVDSWNGEIALRGKDKFDSVHTWSRVKPGQTFRVSHYA